MKTVAGPFLAAPSLRQRLSDPDRLAGDFSTPPEPVPSIV